MPASLVSDWKRVAQSGPTIDDRVIKPEWLNDMAETYDPDVYTAKLWIDHKRYYGSYGSVKALKTEKDGTVVRLFAKINPTRSLLEINQVMEEKLHFSIEVLEDFAKTGKCYLSGLALTDEPASLGTDELRFSRAGGREFTARFPGEAAENFFSTEDDQMVDRFLSRMAGWFFKKNEPKQEEESMDEKALKEFKESLERIHTVVTGMSEAIQKLSAGTQPAAPLATPPETPPATPPDNAKFEELKTGLDAVTAKFDTLMGRLEKAAPGTFVGDTPQPAGDQAELL